MLVIARKDATGGPFIISRIPGTTCILIAKKKVYTQDPRDIGFQFERYVTGGSMSDTSGNPKHVGHIHMMKIGEKTIIFRAEVDAADVDGSLVEVKASNPHYWGTKVMFQMISSGSSKLCHGEKSREKSREKSGRWWLDRITLRSLSSISKKALVGFDIKTLETNIFESMKAIQSQLKVDGTYKVSLSSGSLILQGSVIDLLPPNDIAKALTKPFIDDQDEEMEDAGANLKASSADEAEDPGTCPVGGADDAVERSAGVSRRKAGSPRDVEFSADLGQPHAGERRVELPEGRLSPVRCEDRVSDAKLLLGLTVGVGQDSADAQPKTCAATEATRLGSDSLVRGPASVPSVKLLRQPSTKKSINELLHWFESTKKRYSYARFKGAPTIKDYWCADKNPMIFLRNDFGGGANSKHRTKVKKLLQLVFVDTEDRDLKKLDGLKDLTAIGVETKGGNKGGDLMAVAILQHNTKCSQLYFLWLCVHPEMRGSGMGSLLSDISIVFFQRLLGRNKGGEIIAAVDETNKNGLLFWKKGKFEQLEKAAWENENLCGVAENHNYYYNPNKEEGAINTLFPFVLKFSGDEEEEKEEEEEEKEKMSSWRDKQTNNKEI